MIQTRNCLPFIQSWCSNMKGWKGFISTIVRLPLTWRLSGSWDSRSQPSLLKMNGFIGHVSPASRIQALRYHTLLSISFKLFYVQPGNSGDQGRTSSSSFKVTRMQSIKDHTVFAALRKVRQFQDVKRHLFIWQLCFFPLVAGYPSSISLIFKIRYRHKPKCIDNIITLHKLWASMIISQTVKFVNFFEITMLKSPTSSLWQVNPLGRGSNLQPFSLQIGALTL